MIKKLRLDRFDLFIVFLTVLAYVLVLSVPFKAKPFGDMFFHVETKSLAAFIRGALPFSSVAITHAPGPVFFYLLPYLMVDPAAGDNSFWYAGIIWTSLWMLLSMILLRHSVKKLFGDPTSKLAAIVFAIFPLHIYYSLGIMAESVAFFSVILMIYGWANWRDSGYSAWQRSRGWWLMTIGLAYLILSRPNALFILGLLVLVMALAYKFKKNYFRTTFAAISIMIGLVFVGDYGILEIVKKAPGNKSNAEQEMLLFYVIHEGRFQFRNEPFDWRYWENELRDGSKDYADWVQSKKDLKQEQIATGKTRKEVYENFDINDMLQHPFIVLQQFVIRTLYGHVFIINGVRPWMLKIGKIPGNVVYITLHIFINLLNVILTLSAVRFLFVYKNKLLEFWPLWLPWLALVLFHGLTYMEPRYLLPTKPGIFIMASEVLMSIPLVYKLVSKLFQSNAEQLAN